MPRRISRRRCDRRTLDGAADADGVYSQFSADGQIRWNLPTWTQLRQQFSSPLRECGGQG